MKHRTAPLAMAAFAGLALSASAFAQFGVVSNQPGTFTDIRSTGTVITFGNQDDGTSPFTSSVTNALVTSAALNVCTNGFICNSTATTYTNTPLPMSGITFGLLPYWDDLYDDGTGLVLHKAAVEGGINVEIIEWSQVRTYGGGPGSATGTFEVKIFASGPVYAQFFYPDVTFAGNGIDATVGVQWSASSFDQYSYDTATVANGTVLSIVAAASGACCLPNATCTTMSQGACVGQGGTYHGNDSTCTGTCPIGACCVTGGCQIGTSGGCAALGGIYRGDGTVCPANCPGPTLGPDVFESSLTDVGYFATVGSIAGFAVGTVACNQGDVPVMWNSGNNQHPVVAQNMFRLLNGRFEQIGQSWLKHTFASTNSPGCGTCQNPGTGSLLGIGCSDAYGSGLNGDQPLLGPRSQVNATTGAYPYPFTAPGIVTAIDRLLQVNTSDLTTGGRYFVDAHYVTADDANWNDGLNNCTYQEIVTPVPPNSPAFTGAVHPRDPGIRAWKDNDATVTLVSADYTESGLTARFWVAGKATNNGNGTWHYEYAVYNLNANRNAGTFSVPVAAGVAITNPGFHAPLSHSGEPYSNAAWTSSVASGAVTFATTPYATDQNANAIRWGTMYNFRFDASAAPTTGPLTLGLFAPGSPTSLSVPGMLVPPAPAACYANCDNSTTPPVLNVLDFSCFLNRFAANDPYANCDNSTTPPVLNVLDFSCFLNTFAAGCS